jgi:hypothetical protein
VRGYGLWPCYGRGGRRCHRDSGYREHLCHANGPSAHAYADRHRDADPDRDRDAYAYAYTYANCYANADANADTRAAYRDRDF